MKKKQKYQLLFILILKNLFESIGGFKVPGIFISKLTILVNIIQDSQVRVKTQSIYIDVGLYLSQLAVIQDKTTTQFRVGLDWKL